MVFLSGVNRSVDDYSEMPEEENDGEVAENKVDAEKEQVRLNVTSL